jgi:membrane associated rhomboid family serine protease
MSFQLFTIVFIAITVLVSVTGFNDSRIIDRLILWPGRMNTPSEYHRLLSSGFIHNDGTHLFFNMFTLFFIGSLVEREFEVNGYWLLYPVLYCVGIIAASLPSFIKNRNNAYYRSLGASGGVAAVLFSSVYFAPWNKIYIYFIALPNIVFAGLYLAYSAYMSKRGGDNVNHDAHFWGAVFGFLFTLAIDSDHGRTFLEQMKHPSIF